MERIPPTSERIAGWIYDRRWTCLVVCLAGALLAAVPARHVRIDNSVQRWFVEDDPALAAYRSFQDTYGNDEVVLIALQRDDGMLTPTGFRVLREATRALRSVEGVASVRSLATMKRIQVGLTGPRPVSLVPDQPLSAEQARALRTHILRDSTLYGRFVNDDGTMTAVLVRMKPNDQIDGRRDVILGQIQDTLDRVVRDTNVQWHRAGVGVILHALNEASTEDSRLVLLAANVLIFLLLWGFFRRVGPVLLTLGVVGVATVWLMGAYGWAGLAINTVTLVMPTLVLVICTADCVHFLRRAADLPPDLSPRERAVQSVGALLRPCAVTTLTTALGFAALGVSSIPVVRHLGLFSALGLLFGFGAAVVGCTWGLAYAAVLPRAPESGILRRGVGRLVDASLRHPRVVLLGAALLVLGAGWGIARITVDTNSIGYLFRDHPVRQDARLIEQELGPYAPLEFVVRTDGDPTTGPEDVLTPTVFAAIQRWQQAAVDSSAVGWSYSAVDGIQRLHKSLSGSSESIPERRARIETLVQTGRNDVPYVADLAAHPKQLRVTFGTPMQSANGLQRTIRAVLNTASLPDGLTVEATGYLPLYVRIMTLVVQSQVRSFALALAIILVVIGLLFRSVRAAALAFLPNVLPVLLTLGVMGWIGLPLDIATVTIAAILFGLVVDDSVHLLHRYFARRDAGMSSRVAIQKGARDAGPMIATTTCVLTGGFLVLTLAQVKSVVWFGGLATLGIALALAVDLLVLPALIAEGSRTLKR